MNKPVILQNLGKGVSELILNRPEKLNALSADMIRELGDTLHQLADQNDLRVLLVSGNGKWFCGGADLNWMSDASKLDDKQNIEDARLLANMLQQLNNLPVVTIAKVQGGAMGGAIGILCCCDIVIATDSCRFSFGELRLGLIPATILPYVLARIGEGHTRRLILSAETFNSTLACQTGLIHHSVSDEQLDSATEAHINNILATAPQASRLCKKTILQSQKRLDIDPAQSAEQLAFSRRSAEARAGIQAFLEKQPADWVEHWVRNNDADSDKDS